MRSLFPSEQHNKYHESDEGPLVTQGVQGWTTIRLKIQAQALTQLRNAMWMIIAPTNAFTASSVRSQQILRIIELTGSSI